MKIVKKSTNQKRVSKSISTGTISNYDPSTLATAEIRPEVFINEEVMKKIDYLCSKVGNLEWSGILFYTTEGSIKDISTLKIFLKDILPMDRGTSVSTGFEYDERYTDFIMRDVERLDWRHGIIH